MAKKKRALRNTAQYPVAREFVALEGLRSLDRFGSHSVGVGRKLVGGKPSAQLAVRYYVAQKRPVTRLLDTEKVPESIRFFSRKAGQEVELLTDVIETPPAQFEQVDPETRIRPVPGGVSGGILGSTGTIGGWVWDTTDDTIVMLSNEHVLGTTSGADVLQQGSADGGSLPGDKIGDVKRGIARSAVTPNRVDCSIADPDDSSVYDLTVLEIGPAVYAIDVATLDMAVEKYGQTTRHTFGEIADTDWTGMVSGLPFEDCLFVEVADPSDDWSAGGDSGSCVFSQTPVGDGSDVKPVVGLHFAGSGTSGIECKIQTVFDRLNLTTLCAGAFASFLDSLFEAETEGRVSEESEEGLRSVSALAGPGTTSITPIPIPRFPFPLPFTRKDRIPAAARRPFAGISRDVQARLQGSRRGRVVTDFVDSNRAELLALAARDGDVRRATVAALRPLVAGTTTTTDVLTRVLTARDLHRLEKLAGELIGKGSPKLQAAAKPVVALRRKAEGKSIAEVLGIDV